MIRLDTILEDFTSEEWQPSGETIFQLEAEAAFRNPIVWVQARVDPSAPWATVASLTKNNPIERLTKLPHIRLHLYGNEEGQAVRVYDNEAP